MIDSIYEEIPYAAALAEEAIATHCSGCFLSNTEIELRVNLASGQQATDGKFLKQCAKCHQTKYCSTKCQMSDWQLGHKRECLLYKTANQESTRLPSDHTRCLLRMLMKCDEESKKDTRKAGVRQMTDLMSHREEIRKDGDKMQHYKRVFSDLVNFIEPSKVLTEMIVDMDDELVFGMHCRLMINGFLIGEHLIGTSIYVEISQMNHSCDPDVNVIFNGSRACVRAVKPTSQFSTQNHKNLTSIRTSYCEPMSSRQCRMNHMKKSYYFACDCRRCTDKISEENLEGRLNRIKCGSCANGSFAFEFDSLTATPALNLSCAKCQAKPSKKRLAQLKSQLCALMVSLSAMDENIDDEDELEVVVGYGADLSTFCEQNHWLLLKARRMAFNMAFGCEQHEMVIELSASIFPTIQLYGLPYHATLPLLQYKLAKSYIALHRFVDGRMVLQTAQDVLQFSHGKTHSLMLEMNIFGRNLDNLLSSTPLP